MTMDITHYDINHGLHIKIAVITDLHGRGRPDIIDYVRKGMPDIIIIAGDLFDGRKIESFGKEAEITKGKLFLKELLKIAPVYFGLGNHEWKLQKEDKLNIISVGINLLDDEWAQFIPGVYIGALTSTSRYGKYSFTSKEPNVKFLNEFEGKAGFKILICHHPEYYDKYLADRKIDLILSGHAHGGQIRIGNQGLYAPGQGFFPKYTSGVVDGKLIISRGLSNTKILIPRLFNKTELVFVDL